MKAIGNPIDEANELLRRVLEQQKQKDMAKAARIEGLKAKRQAVIRQAVVKARQKGR